MKKLSIIFGAALLLAISGFSYSQLATPTQRPCGETTAVARILSKDFQENMVMHGSVEGGAILSLWASKEKKTWTIVLTTGNTTCYITSGSNFKLLGDPI